MLAFFILESLHNWEETKTDFIEGFRLGWQAAIKVPAKNGDVLFADNWLYYDVVGTGGRYTWSIIQFDVSCE